VAVIAYINVRVDQPGASIPLKNMLEMGEHPPLKNLPSCEREALEIRADRA